MMTARMMCRPESDKEHITDPAELFLAAVRLFSCGQLGPLHSGLPSHLFSLAISILITWPDVFWWDDNGRFSSAAHI